VIRTAVIPVYRSMTAAESWALICDHSEDGDQPVPLFVRLSELGAEPDWTAIVLDDDGHYVREFDDDED
jgi:hypothetical protein